MLDQSASRDASCSATTWHPTGTPEQLSIQRVKDTLQAFHPIGPGIPQPHPVCKWKSLNEMSFARKRRLSSEEACLTIRCYKRVCREAIVEDKEPVSWVPEGLFRHTVRGLPRPPPLLFDSTHHLLPMRTPAKPLKLFKDPDTPSNTFEHLRRARRLFARSRDPSCASHHAHSSRHLPF